jgi:alpha,alpha-trehalose phosphorylase
MGGTWMVFTYGFGGLRDYDGRLTFRPQRSPEAQSSLQFPLTYRGRGLNVEIGPVSTTYTLREGDDLALRHGDEVVALTRANPVVVRPTMKP